MIQHRKEIIARLTAIEADILKLGVRRLSLFGSVRRDEATPSSDIDILVEFDPTRKTYDAFLDLTDLLEQTLGGPVDVVTTEALSPYIGPHIVAEAEDVIRAA
jgi:predicted nucleotidyltransferase